MLGNFKEFDTLYNFVMSNGNWMYSVTQLSPEIMLRDYATEE